MKKRRRRLELRLRDRRRKNEEVWDSWGLIGHRYEKQRINEIQIHHLDKPNIHSRTTTPSTKVKAQINSTTHHHSPQINQHQPIKLKTSRLQFTVVHYVLPAQGTETHSPFINPNTASQLRASSLLTSASALLVSCETPTICRRICTRTPAADLSCDKLSRQVFSSVSAALTQVCALLRCHLNDLLPFLPIRSISFTDRLSRSTLSFRVSRQSCTAPPACDPRAVGSFPPADILLMKVEAAEARFAVTVSAAVANWRGLRWTAGG
ncbi:uncharacterized protein LOC110017889 [Phalaenopsis equestris]|uniref:uncharacterized protein LOC110017889 n=1 Tax=Phalaenopsis equestris TaxID=78828 RepID=UPI0009E4626E|nr:uncharacterized protein LOC110017889 [Phalaenopsis equestris]